MEDNIASESETFDMTEKDREQGNVLSEDIMKEVIKTQEFVKLVEEG